MHLTPSRTSTYINQAISVSFLHVKQNRAFMQITGNKLVICSLEYRILHVSFSRGGGGGGEAIKREWECGLCKKYENRQT
jgi:hypothetical protein